MFPHRRGRELQLWSAKRESIWLSCKSRETGLVRALCSDNVDLDEIPVMSEGWHGRGRDRISMGLRSLPGLGIFVT
ncbi:hypothetical protein CDL15_Pgr023999 [Punica granatum]|uniref:Uncharacterized protein n=1 Tax=Punica granatum TaxID=22663 RepID=A0A218XWU0_PUNGR|nr:hypothetical protein CDL15_Pgr023999 [Punica granatum]